jgi:hypothetical protein
MKLSPPTQCSQIAAVSTEAGLVGKCFYDLKSTKIDIIGFKKRAGRDAIVTTFVLMVYGPAP